ncbi:MAG: TPM domain-containing protein [Rubrivivax sp.]
MSPMRLLASSFASARQMARAAVGACLLAAALLVGAALPAGAQLPVPELSGRVIDQTGTLNAAQRSALESKLAGFEAQAGPQIVVLLVPTTAPEDIAAYAQRVADQWKIGRRDQGDGLLLVVAKNDRRVRIEVAKALEGAVPDLAARQIIDNAIRPAFRADDYAGGLNAALDQLMARIRGEGLPAPAPPLPTRDGAQPGLQLEEIAMFLFVAVPIIATVLIEPVRAQARLAAGGRRRRRHGVVVHGQRLAGRRRGAGGTGAGGHHRLRRRWPNIAGRRGGLPRVGGWDGGGWGGGWSGGGGGSSGGGFSSGGGGDFGGGGASGDW